MRPSSWVWSALLGIACGAVLYLLGMPVPFAIAAVGVPVALMLTRAAARAAPPSAPAPPRSPGPVTTRGNRADLARLAWSVREKRGHVGPFAMSRLRTVATDVLRSRGVPATGREAAASIEAVLGADGRELFARHDPRLSVVQYERLVRRLSALSVPHEEEK